MNRLQVNRYAVTALPPTSVVPANGCLATLPLRWSCQGIEDSSQRQPSAGSENPSRRVNGNLRFPLTFTYHGCPQVRRPGSPKTFLKKRYLTLVTNMLLYKMIVVREYLAPDGKSSFGVWFEHLNAEAAAKVSVALTRLESGNLSNVKGVGGGVYEYRIDFGPGYRIYLGKDGDQLVILLAGGTKKRQQRDIEHARAYWQDYKRRKTGGL